MDRRAAVVISDILVSVYESLHDSIDQVRSVATGEENKAYCRLVAHVLGNILLELMVPLYEAHTMIMPEFLKQPAVSTDVDFQTNSMLPNRLAQGPERATDVEPRIKLDALMDKIVTQLEKTVMLVEQTCSEAKSKEYRDRTVEILAHVADTKAYILARHFHTKASTEASGDK